MAILLGSEEDDILIGTSSNDAFFGFDGVDTAVYVNHVLPEDISLTDTGWLVTTWLEGEDTLDDIEIIRYGDSDLGGQILLVGNGGFDSVEEAVINAGSFDTVMIAPGTFDGNVLIDQSLTIAGAASGVSIGGSATVGLALASDVEGPGIHVSIGNLTISDNLIGIYVMEAATIRSLSLDNVNFNNNRGVGIGTEFDSNLENLEISNSTFVANGDGNSTFGGTSAIILLEYKGNLLVANTTFDSGVTGATPASIRPHTAIQINGREHYDDNDTPSDPNDDTTSVDDPSGFMVFSDVRIEGWYQHAAISIQGYTDLTNIFFDNVSIEAGSALGPLVYIDPTGSSTVGWPTIMLPTEFNGGGVETSTLDLSGITITNLNLSATIDVFVGGTAGADIITGTNGRDELNAPTEDGADYGGDDQLSGEAGNDILHGGLGDDLLDGGADNDLLIGGEGADALYGEDGSDRVSYQNAAVGLVANLADASQNTGDAAGDSYDSIESLTGSIYDDTLTGNVLKNSIIGGTGHDTINGLAGNDSLYGGDGNDVLNGGLGGDYLSGGAGSDWVTYANATKGVRVNLSDSSQNTAEAAGDTYNSIENLIGTSFNDSILGSAGANRIEGGNGNDVINGMEGSDTIVGGAGNDRIYGQLGNDVLTGGVGQDTFIFHKAPGSGNVDTITDFSSADDTIELHRSVFAALTEAGALAADLFKDIATGTKDASDRIIYDSRNGSLYYDADGSGTAFGNVRFAVLTDAPTISAVDFVVI